jgi:hypothetical protein
MLRHSSVPVSVSAPPSTRVTASLSYGAKCIGIALAITHDGSKTAEEIGSDDRMHKGM